MTTQTPPIRFVLCLLFLMLVAAPFSSAESAEDYWRSSVNAEQQGDYNQAIKDVYNYKAKGGDPYLFAMRAAWICTKAGEKDKAASFYEMANQSSPQAINPMLELAKLAYARQDWKATVRSAGGVLRVAPGHYNAGLMAGEASFKLGNYSAAYQIFSTLAKGYPEDATVLSWQAWCLINKRSKVGARRLFEKVLLLSPGHPYAAQGLKLCE